MSVSTEYAKASEIRVGDILTHPYTTWEVTKVTVTPGLKRYTFEVTPSNSSYEKVLMVWDNAIFTRQTR